MAGYVGSHRRGHRRAAGAGGWLLSEDVGWGDPRVIEALLACPFLIMAIAPGRFRPSLTNAMIAIGLSAMPIFARLTRGQ